MGDHSKPHAGSPLEERIAALTPERREVLGRALGWGTPGQAHRPSRHEAAPIPRRTTNDAMRITDVRTTIVGTPWRELVFLELITDEGLVGLSEARMVNKTSTLVACIGELAPRYVIGTDPFDVERLAWNVIRAEYGRAGEIAQSTLASFEVACWDLMGQSLGVPVWKLLGGKFRDRVPAYANGWYQAEREAGAIARLARGVVERGYRALKLDPFGAASAELPAADRRRAESIVAAVRAHWGIGSRLLSDIFLGGGDSAEHESFARFQREAATADTAAALLRLVYRLDVRPHLPLVRAPTLVVHRRYDRAVPYLPLGATDPDRLAQFCAAVMAP